MYVDSHCRRFVATEPIALYSLVKLDGSNRVGVNDLTDTPIGVAMRQAFAEGDEIAVKMLNAPGSFPGIAAEAFSANVLLFTENGGTLQDTAATGAKPIGRSFKAAAAGEYFEWIPAGASYAGEAAE